MAAVLAASLTSTAGEVADPFRGNWESIDVDGSYQRMAIGGGGAGGYRVNYYDTGATVCGAPDPVTGDWPYAAQARGVGEALPGTGVLEGTWDVWCLTAPPTLVFDDLAFRFEYDPSSDTLADNFGVVWTRR